MDDEGASTGGSAGVSLRGIRKSYDGTEVIPGLDLEIGEGEFVVIVGPSGCGKSTLLRMIAGLEPTSGGRIRIRGRDVTRAKPKQRDIAMVFQSYALYPHMDVAGNMSFALRLAGTDKAEIERRVRVAAQMLDMEPLLGRKPKELSGGQRQRVAMGRAIVRDAYCFLFDEPLSNLDAKLRSQMRTELTLLHKRLERTMIYVTHDQIEAMTMADRIVIMSKGVVQQVGTPREVYNAPVNRFVAGFIGSPSMNFEEAAIVDGASPWQVFTRVLFPLMRSGYAVAGIFTFRIAWNEFILALLLTGRSSRTLPVAASGFITDTGVEWGNIMAMGTLIVIPPLLFTFFAARQIIAGMTAGAVKG